MTNNDAGERETLAFSDAISKAVAQSEFGADIDQVLDIDGVSWTWLLVPLVFPVYSLAAIKAVIEYPFTWAGEVPCREGDTDDNRGLISTAAFFGTP